MPIEYIDRKAAAPNEITSTLTVEGLQLTAKAVGSWMGESLDVSERTTLSSRTVDSTVDVYIVRADGDLRILVADTMDNDGSVSLEHYAGIDRILRMATLKIPAGTVDLQTAKIVVCNAVSKA